MMTNALPYRPCVGIMLLDRRRRVWIGRRIPKAHDRPAAAGAGGEDTDEKGAASTGAGGERRAGPGRGGRIWQMPQGGIDAGEVPEAAALRELAEETGVTSVRILGQTADWLSYDLPADLVDVALRGKYRGQRQKWFAMRFLGEDGEIDIAAPGGHVPEFDAWRWVPMAELPELIVPFKRAVYEQVLGELAPLAGQEN